MKHLLSDNNELSHKRLIAIMSFGCLITTLIANLFGKQVQPDLLWIFGATCIGESGYTIIEKFNKQQK